MPTPTLPPPPPVTAPGLRQWLQQLWATASRVRLGQDSPTVTYGAGVPATDQPSGSVYLRTDGPPSLYAREGGSWVAK